MQILEYLNEAVRPTQDVLHKTGQELASAQYDLDKSIKSAGQTVDQMGLGYKGDPAEKKQRPRPLYNVNLYVHKVKDLDPANHVSLNGNYCLELEGNMLYFFDAKNINYLFGLKFNKKPKSLDVLTNSPDTEYLGRVELTTKSDFPGYKQNEQVVFKFIKFSSMNTLDRFSTTNYMFDFTIEQILSKYSNEYDPYIIGTNILFRVTPQNKNSKSIRLYSVDGLRYVNNPDIIHQVSILLPYSLDVFFARNETSFFALKIDDYQTIKGHFKFIFNKLKTSN